MAMPLVKFEKDRLTVEFGDGRPEWRDLQRSDHNRFHDWTIRCRTALQSAHDEATLLALDREINGWLDGTAN